MAKGKRGFLATKTGMKWLQDGDKNTKIFHSYIKGRSRKLHINKILNKQDEEITEGAQIGSEIEDF